MPKFEREVEIDVQVEKVWDALTDPSYWPKWFPGMETVSNVSSVAEGGRFDWTDKDRTGYGKIVKLEQNKRLEILTVCGDDKDSHVFTLRPSGGFFGLNDDECKIKYVYDTLAGGGILGNFILGGNPVDALRVKNALNQFRRLVESL